MRSGFRFRVASAAIAVASVVTNGLFLSAGSVLAVSAPVARWALDDGSGLTASDSVGTANGTLSGGATWLTSNAAVGTGALRFDGVNDEMTVLSQASVEPAQGMISVWVRGAPGDQPAVGEVILEKGAFDCNGPSYGFYVASGGIRFSFRSPNGYQLETTVTAAEARVSLWDGAWHLLAASVRHGLGVPDAVEARLYIDGYPNAVGVVGDTLASGQHTAAIRYTGATQDELRIGGPVASGCGGGHFKGDIDDVRIYTDPDFPNGSLMPPIATSITGLGNPTAHPGGNWDHDVVVTPTPRWTNLFGMLIYLNGSWQGYCCGGSPDADTGHAIGSSIAPNAVGTYPFRFVYTEDDPYQGSYAESTLTVTPWPSTTTASTPAGAKIPYTNIVLDAQVTSAAITGNTYPVGSIKFWETTSGTPALLGTSPVYPNTAGVATAQIVVNTWGAGTHKVVAEFVGPDPIRAGSSSSELSIDVGKNTPRVFLGNLSGDPVDAHNTFVLGTVIDLAGQTYVSGATMSFTRVGQSTPTCVVPVVLGPYTQCTMPALPIGTYQFVASYSGNADTSAGVSDPLTVHVVADTIHAGGVGLQYSTFYPVTDGYEDTVAIRGTRNEPIGVSIKIYSPAGSLLKTVTIASGTGAYSFAWNGRNSAGSIYAEGRYRVVQVLKDAGGTTYTQTAYVTLSKKKLYSYSATITKYGSSITAKGTAFGGTVTVSTTSHYAKLVAPSTGSSWAGAGWELTLPSAAIYKSFYVKVYGRHSGATGYTALGAQNFSTCAYVASATWNEGCFSAWKAIATTTGTTLHTYGTAYLSSAYRHGNRVRVIVSSYGGTTFIYKAQVYVTYAILKY